MHLKRKAISKTWPIPRKKLVYVIVPSHNKKSGIPLLIVIRDILKFVKTRKELKIILQEGKILVNDKIVRDEKYSLTLFDTLSLPSIKKFYRMTFLETRKITLEEIDESETKEKIAKVINKKILKGKKNQLNLQDGHNIISNEKVDTGDSILINFKDKKIVKILPVREKALAIVIKGKHLGKQGVIEKIENNEAIIKHKNEELKIKEEELIVIR